MSNRVVLLIAINILMCNVWLIGLARKQHNIPVVQVTPVTPVVPVEPIKPPPKILKYEIKTPVPGFLTYDETKKQLDEWKYEAPEIVELGTYGKSSQEKDLVYVRIHDPNTNDVEPVVLVTAAIHGNESWGSGIVMAYIGTILSQFNNDDIITEIVKTTDLYFIPIVSPDVYPDRREVDGVDPNRNFPTKQDPGKTSIKPIRCLQEFFMTLRPSAVISGHTFGRVYLQPHGYSTENPPHHEDYQRILGKMAESSKYEVLKASQLYRRPIFGTELDWYYKYAAFSIVAEYGTHQHPPTQDEIESEFNRTFQAFLYFVREAPKVKIEFWTRREAA